MPYAIIAISPDKHLKSLNGDAGFLRVIVHQKDASLMFAWCVDRFERRRFVI
jgi:hypothetical protein